MNVVLDDAEELSIKKKTRKALGRILLKGDNITLMMNTCARRTRAHAVSRRTDEAQSGRAAVPLTLWRSLVCCPQGFVILASGCGCIQD